jgi:hypothetical protein
MKEVHMNMVRVRENFLSSYSPFLFPEIPDCRCFVAIGHRGKRGSEGRGTAPEPHGAVAHTSDVHSSIKVLMPFVIYLHRPNSTCQPSKFNLILLRASNSKVRKSADKQCLNSVAVSVLKIKSIHAECLMKLNDHSCVCKCQQ